jgi:hypothetical protein
MDDQQWMILRKFAADLAAKQRDLSPEEQKCLHDALRNSASKVDRMRRPCGRN